MGSLVKKSFFDEENDTEDLSVVSHETVRSKVRKPAWNDEEEDAVKMNIANVNRLRKLRKVEKESVISGSDYISRLRAQHVKIYGSAQWADLDNEESNEDEQFLQEVDGILGTKNEFLQPGKIDMTRLRNANEAEPCNGVVRSVEFHPNGQLLLTGSLDKKLRFFEIDGKANRKVQTIFLEDLPISKASFTGDGSKVVMAGRRKWFYVADLVHASVEKVNGIIGRDERSLESFEVSPDSKVAAFLGNNGHIMIVSMNTKQLVGNLKMNGSVRSASFSADGQQLITGGGDGELYFWDLRTRRCFHKARDDGCVTVTSLDTSSNGRYFAAGSDAGIVNLYDQSKYLGNDHTPRKVFSNLTTGIDVLKFNHDSQILATSSRFKKDSLRLIHVPSNTVFSNWPTNKTPLHYVHSLDFSPSSGYLAVGNAKGNVLLYRLHHYETA